MIDDISKSKFKYTIIVPHYKDVDGLERLIDSIPDRADIQLIVIDDNSYESGSIEDKENKERLLQLSNSPRRMQLELYFKGTGKQGAGGCRNIGLAHVKGEWLVFSDADDFFTDRAFEILDNGIESLSNEEELIYFFPKSIKLPSGQPGNREARYIKRLKGYLKTKDFYSELQVRYGMPIPWTKAIKASVIKDNNIEFDDVMWSNDVMFSTKCGYYAKRIKVIPETIYVVTCQDGTLTTAKSEKQFRVRMDVYVRKYVFLREHLSVKEYKWFFGWGQSFKKIINAVKDGYGLETIGYILKLYRENRIPLIDIHPTYIERTIYKIKNNTK